MKNIKRWLIFAILMMPATVFAAGDDHGFSVSGFLWRVFIFAIFAVIMYKLLKDRVKNALASGVKDVVDSIAEAEKACANAEAELAEYSRKLAGMSEELENMKIAARKTAEQEAEAMIAEAEKTAEKYKEMTKNTISTELEKAKAELRKEMVNDAVEAAEKQLASDSDTGKKKKFIADNISNIGAN